MNPSFFLTLTKMSQLPLCQVVNKPEKASWLFLLLAALILFQPSKGYTQEPFQLTTQAIDAYFSRLEAFGLSGSLLIGNKENILFKKDYGHSVPAKGVDPAYLVGSLTKQFTASAILLLEQRGLLNTNDPLSKYLPEVPADKSQITIHQLLTHTSGLKDDYWDQNKTLTEKEYIAKMLSEALQAEPGTRFSYANFGYHLLARIIKAVSNKDYEHFLVQELFQPNGMEYTGFNLVNWKENQVAQYTDWTTAASEQILKNPLSRPVYLQPEGSGGLLSTTADLYKWYQAIFHSEKVLSRSSRAKLLTVEKENYGYGWEIYQTSRGTQLIEHGGYDSWVGVVTGLYNFAEEDIVVIFLGNTHMSQFLLKEEIMNNIEALVFGGSVRIPPAPASDYHQVDLEQYVGVYKNEEKSIAIDQGKLSHQIRLRTKDEEVIRQLLFPDLKQPAARTDVQLEYVFNHLNNQDYEPLREVFFNHAPFEAVINRYSSIWQQLTSSMGNFEGIRVLHTMPNYYEGRFELQIFAALLFENGTFYGRAFRDQSGRIHLQRLDFPKKLDIFLIPSKEGEYVYWNVKTGIISTIKIYQNKLSLNGYDDLKFVKE